MPFEETVSEAEFQITKIYEEAANDILSDSDNDEFELFVDKFSEILHSNGDSDNELQQRKPQIIDSDSDLD